MRPLNYTNEGLSRVDLFGNKVELARQPLAARFGVPPFSLFDVKTEVWSKRKQEWIRMLKVRGEEGRDSVAELSSTQALAEGQGRLDAFRDKIGTNSKVNNICSEKWGRGQEIVPGGGGPGAVRRKGPTQLGKCFNSGESGDLNAHLKRGDNTGAAGQHGTLGISDSAMRLAGGYHEGDGQAKSTAGTSIFDPVLCEIGYRWFAPQGGRILDPFAGGSTRGLVAAYLGYQYTGIELRPDQILANERQAAELETEFQHWYPGEEWQAPEWIEGTAEHLSDLLVLQSKYDLIFSCPPYYNLEVYSEDAHDGSAQQTYEEFMVWYENIFRQAVAKLNWNRFVFVTVGDVRNKKSGLGKYHPFEHDQYEIFVEKLGLHYYNRATLATAIGSLPVRIDKQFGRFRKLGNTTQMCYIFWKGDDDADAIKQALGTMAAKDGYEGE